MLALLDRLDRVKQTSPDSWRALCPAHEGRSLSLSIKLADDRLLVRCFAGCDTQQVCESVGLTISDLFEKSLPYSAPAARQHRINTSAREVIESIIVPVRTVMMAVQIQEKRAMTPGEKESFNRASATINQALDTAVNEGVINDK